ncbi:MAG: efflux transporter outer membrane subunit [Dokdonella sp.]
MSVGTFRRVGCLAMLLGVAACTTGPLYREPQDEAPAAYRFAGSGDVEFPASGWWTVFGDAELDRQVEAVLRANQNLLLALARFDESRALLGVTRADELPSVAFDPLAARARTSGTISNRFPALETTLYRVPFDAAYEIDLWGRVRHSVAAAEAQLEGSADAIAAMRLALTAEAAATYFSIRSTDRETEVLERTLGLRRDALQLVERRAHAGTVGDLDVVRARADLALTEADLQDSRRRRELAQHALAVLEDRNAITFALPMRADTADIPEIPAGLPADLLRRRPDVAQNERALKAANERIGIAEAAFFPSIRLTALAGVASNDLSTLLDKPSEIWSIGPVISLPVFDGGRNRGNLQAAQARFRQAAAIYRLSVLGAFRETQDSLSDTAYLSERAGSLHAAVVASVQAAKISRSRYDRGLVSYFEVVESERSALAAQRAEIQNDQQRLVATVSLIKSLGGGWSVKDTPAASVDIATPTSP